jgi:hypothetical protein
MCKIGSEKFSTFSKCREMCSTCAKIPYLASTINGVAALWFFHLSALFWVWWLTANPANCCMSALCCDNCGYKYSGKLESFIKSACDMKAGTLSKTQTLFYMTNHIIALSPWKLQIQYSSLSVHVLNTLSVHTKENYNPTHPYPHSVKTVEFLFSYSVYCFSDVIKPTQITQQA